MTRQRLEELRTLLDATAGFLRANEEKDFLALCRSEQQILDFARFLYAEIRLRLDAIENGGSDEPGCTEPQEPDLGNLFAKLAVTARAGVLAELLTEENQAMVAETLGGVADLAERALRKKDTAAYLRHSADTDAHLAEQRRMRELMKKKDT